MGSRVRGFKSLSTPIKYMIRKALFAAAVFTVFLAPAAAEVSISPSEYSIDMVSGETQVQNVDLSWSGRGSAEIVLNTSMSPMSEGIEAYTDQVVYSLDSGETKQIQIIVDSSPGLKSGDFTVNTKTQLVYSSEEIERRISRGSSGLTVTEDGETRSINESDWRSLQDRIEELEQERERELNQIEDLESSLNESRQDLNSTEDELEATESDFNEAESRLADARERLNNLRYISYALGLLLALITGLSAYYYFYRPEKILELLRKRKDDKDIEEMF